MRKQRIYVITDNDSGNSEFTKSLTEYDGILFIATPGRPLQHPGGTQFEMIAAFLAEEKYFKNKHTQYLPTVESILNRKIPIPDELLLFLGRLKVPFLAVNRASIGTDGLKIGLYNFHYRDLSNGSWHGPKIKRKGERKKETNYPLS